MLSNDPSRKMYAWSGPFSRLYIKYTAPVVVGDPERN